MKNLPLSSTPVSLERTLLPLSAQPLQQSIAQEVATLKGVSKDFEASVVNLPRTKAKSSAVEDAESVLGSFLGEIRNQTDIISAHGGLDASRVFDLLNDDDD